MRIQDSATDFDAWVLFGVIDNQLTAKIHGETDAVSNHTLKMIVNQAEAIVLNAHAFTTGEIFDRDIVTIASDIKGKEDGSVAVASQDNVHEVVRDRTFRVSSQDVRILCLSDAGIYIRACLNDLKAVLEYPEDAPFYCYRAIETLRQHVGVSCGVKSKEQQWKRLREITGVTRNDIDDVETLADSLRHGEPARFSGADWQRCVALGWDVTESYMLHLLESRSSRDGTAERFLMDA